MVKWPRIKLLEYQLGNARTYNEWFDIAKVLDSKTGAAEWQATDESPLYPWKRVKEHTAQINQYLQQNDPGNLAYFLHESLYLNWGDISNPALYQEALTGTKHLIEAYLQTISKSLEFLSQTSVPGMSDTQKNALYAQSAHNFGRSALLLSGGAAWGVYHLGVVKALWLQDVLPKVISGASMGSFIASVVCVRSDKEIQAMYDAPEMLNTEAFRVLNVAGIWTNKSLMDSQQLLECIKKNVGEYTFEEAYLRSGRVLNIPVSPVRAGQKARLLSYLTTPDVMVSHSSLASCAVPGIFPPVSLIAKNIHGEIKPYLDGEKWIDGSIHDDLPIRRLSRLHNVNHSIVSQANPHILPFLLSKNTDGLTPFAVDLTTSVMHAASIQAVKALNQRVNLASQSALVRKAYGVIDQKYTGDINIYPGFNPLMYYKLLSNPTREGMENFILEGERATWPLIPRIRDQTLISRTFEKGLRTISNLSKE
ncbi:MAG: DUF3336 domain-containing protein [SAR324 cluster bacterium]|nr:DUF3336 domain-containing protein [SAR324 cluster bacterium]